MPFPTAPAALTGFERCMLGFLDSAGNFTGQQVTLSAGSSSGAFVWSEVRTANYNPQSPVNLDLQGGDIIFGRVRYGNTLTQPFQIIGSSFDQVQSDAITGTTTNVGNSMASIAVLNTANPKPRNMCVMLQSRADATDGSHYYLTRIFPNCAVTISNNGPQFQGLADTIIDVTPSFTTKFINGQVLDATGLNFSAFQNKSDHFYYYSSNAVYFAAFRQNAAATTFTPTYKPLSSVVTLNATPNWFWIGGVSTALSNFSTSTGLATLVGAGSNNVADLLAYEVATF